MSIDSCKTDESNRRKKTQYIFKVKHSNKNVLQTWSAELSAAVMDVPTAGRMAAWMAATSAARRVACKHGSNIH